MSVGVPSSPGGPTDSQATAPAAPPVLRGESLVKEFGGLVAVNDVSIEIPEHSIVSIIGPNGAGKTTLFNMLTGLYKPTRGRMWFDGRDITRSRPDVITGARRRPHISEHPAVRSHERAGERHGRPARPDESRPARVDRAYPGVRREERAVRDRAAESLDLRWTAATAVRPGGDQPLLRRSAPGGDRPRAGLRAEAAAARRADGRDEPAGVGIADGVHAQAARRACR